MVLAVTLAHARAEPQEILPSAPRVSARSRGSATQSPTAGILPSRPRQTIVRGPAARESSVAAGHCPARSTTASALPYQPPAEHGRLVVPNLVTLALGDNLRHA
ncbi:hypothetical protein ACWDWV_27630, partial [Streptosporangium sandarakinum]